MEKLLSKQRNILLNIAQETERKGISNKENVALLKTKNIELDLSTLIRILYPIGYTLRVVSLTENKGNIKELFEKYNGEYNPKEINWGKPMDEENI